MYPRCERKNLAKRKRREKKKEKSRENSRRMIRSATPSEYETTYSLRRWSIIGARSGGAEMVEKEKGEKSRRGGRRRRRRGEGEGDYHSVSSTSFFPPSFFFSFSSFSSLFSFFFTTEQTIIRIRTALSEITSARSIVFARFKGMKYTAQTKDGPIDENYREGRTIDVP